MTNEWTKAEHAHAYLARKDEIPHRQSGEQTLLSETPSDANRILDLGCGDGHLLSLVLAHCPQASGVGVDFSPAMLSRARERFGNQSHVELLEHDLDNPLPNIGAFDVIVSSFAIHHCTDKRKRSLYAEIYDLLTNEGVFGNLEHVASPTEAVHERFLDALGVKPEEEDPSNKLLDVETQLTWLRELGFQEVDCYWKWRELALLLGRKAA